MEPAISTGSVIVIYDIQPSEVAEDDIITFSSGDSPVTGERELTTHRVIDVQGSAEDPRFQTKGDNNEDPDPITVSGDQIVGKHAFTIPYLGYLLVELRSMNAFVLLVIIPAALLIINELRKVKTEASNLKQQGKDQELIGTALLTTAIIFSLIIAGFYTGIIPELIQQTGYEVSLGPTVLGIIMMASMLLSMVVLKLI